MWVSLKSDFVNHVHLTILYEIIGCQYCCSTPGSVNPAGDTLMSIAETLGLSNVLKYLKTFGADLKGEYVMLFAISMHAAPYTLMYMHVHYTG